MDQARDPARITLVTGLNIIAGTGLIVDTSLTVSVTKGTQ